MYLPFGYTMISIIFLPTYLVVSSITAWMLRFKKSAISIAAIITLALLIFTGVSATKYVSKCGLSGCSNDVNLAQIALNREDEAICDLAPSAYKSHPTRPRFTFSKHYPRTSSDCYHQLAKLKNDPTICAYGGTYLLDECFQNFPNEDLSPICASLPDTDSKSLCYFTQAINREDEKYCFLIGKYSGWSSNESRGINACLYTLALKKKDPKICDLIDPKLPLPSWYQTNEECLRGTNRK